MHKKRDKKKKKNENSVTDIWNPVENLRKHTVPYETVP